MAGNFLGLNLPEWLINGIATISHVDQDQRAIQENQGRYNASLALAMGIVDRGTSAPPQRGYYENPQQIINRGSRENVGNLSDYYGDKPDVGSKEWLFGQGSLVGGLGIV